MAAESFPFFFFVFSETTEKSAAFFFLFRDAGIGQTADPRGSVELNCPVASKEMTSLGSLMGATDKDGSHQKGNGNNTDNFGGE
jgi:hypothetical protein